MYTSSLCIGEGDVIMNQRQLRYFLEVYTRMSISHAAEALYISPQALSKTISNLEKELNVHLFQRKSNGIVPTKAAHTLHTHAQNLLQEYDIIEKKLFQHEEITKVVSISCSYDVPQMMSADFLYEFYTQNPNIHLHIQEFPDNHIIEQLRDSTIELGILPGYINPQEFTMEQLFSDDFCLLVYKSHPLAAKEVISISDLDKESIIVKDMTNGTSESQYNTFLQYDASPKIVMEISDLHLTTKFVEKEHCIAMTLQSLAKNIHSDNIIVLPFVEKWSKKTLYLAHKKDNILSREAQLFREQLLAYYRHNL